MRKSGNATRLRSCIQVPCVLRTQKQEAHSLLTSGYLSMSCSHRISTPGVYQYKERQGTSSLVPPLQSPLADVLGITLLIYCVLTTPNRETRYLTHQVHQLGFSYQGIPARKHQITLPGIYQVMSCSSLVRFFFACEYLPIICRHKSEFHTGSNPCKESQENVIIGASPMLTCLDDSCTEETSSRPRIFR
jgi:hypothetical protein